MDFSASLVSRTKMALHSAAAKAEKVLADFKTDLKNDRGEENDGDYRKRLETVVDCEVHFIDEVKVEAEAKDSINFEDITSSSDILPITPSFIVKQLAMAIEIGKKFKSMKDIQPTRGSPPIKDMPGLGLLTVKSLVLCGKGDSLSPGNNADEDVAYFMHLLFNSEDYIQRRKNDFCSSTLDSCIPSDMHSAPQESFVVRLSEIIGCMKTIQKMASFWCSVVMELRRLWSEGQPIPHVPLDETPNLNYCLLHQQLQVVNCCTARKKGRDIAAESTDSVVGTISYGNENSGLDPCKSSSSPMLYARIKDRSLVLRMGADCPCEGLFMLETGEPVYCPVTQDGPILTEDLIRENEEFVIKTGSVGAGCSQLFSDMQAFKAANPGCILEDFIRWHSPPDWVDTAESFNKTDVFLDGRNTLVNRGQLSTRMQKAGNLWFELWETAKPLPAIRQTPLFDEDLAVEGIFNVLENISPSDLFRQLFISMLSSGFIIAEAMIHGDTAFSRLFYQCKDYVISNCQGDSFNAHIDDLCKVYETVEAIVVHPEEALKSITRSEEIIDEPKGRFLNYNLNFSGIDKKIMSKTMFKGQKRADDNKTLLSQLLDNSSSLFTRRQMKPSKPEAAMLSSPNEHAHSII